jgi:hypothetical protein
LLSHVYTLKFILYEHLYYSLADSLDLEMPDLPEDEGTTKIGGTIIRDGSLNNEKEVFIL